MPPFNNQAQKFFWMEIFWDLLQIGDNKVLKVYTNQTCSTTTNIDKNVINADLLVEQDGKIVTRKKRT